MGQAIRRIPGAMPSVSQVQRVAEKADLTVPMLVAGSRGDRRLKNPDYAVHANYTWVEPPADGALAGKRVLIFIHGYNVAARAGLDSAAEFFKLLQDAFAGEDDVDLERYAYVLFTWPGDVGPVYFNDAQQFAHHSGVGMYHLVRELYDIHHVESVSIITHSLGAHVGLRAASVLGERLYRRKFDHRVDHVVLLAPAVENDVFHRPRFLEHYHFPESAFGMKQLHMVCSRGDAVLKKAFSLSELDRALGYSGPESMSPLVSLARRVKEVLGEEQDFAFEVHDFSPSSATIMNPDLWVDGHGSYWEHESQVKYYTNMLLT